MSTPAGGNEAHLLKVFISLSYFPPSRPFLDAYLLHPGLSDETRQ